MLFSSHVIPRSVGWGAGGTVDKILHGKDSRHVSQERREKAPTLQNVLYYSLVGEMVNVTLIDGREISGVLTSVLDEGARIMIDTSIEKDSQDQRMVVQVRRVRFLVPNDQFNAVVRIQESVS